MAGLYVHIPFCLSKCAYCDFVSLPGHAAWMDDYTDALLKEMAGRASGKDGRAFDEAVDTVYFGGGTPTALGARRLLRVLDGALGYFNVRCGAEITVEANPGTADAAFYKALRRAGVNRLSLGVQSLDDGALARLGRVHTAREAVQAVETAHGAGFDNLSIDLMYGLEGQTAFDVSPALGLPVTHISLYALKAEEGTPLGDAVARGAAALPDEDRQAEMYEQALGALRGAGFARYEVSNFALPGFESRHNSGYWRRTPYLGLGASAHSLVGEVRWRNNNDVIGYIADPFTRFDEERLTPEDIAAERVMLGLRLAEGVEASGMDGVLSRAGRMIEGGFLIVEGGRMRLTDRGFMLMNGVLGEILP